MKISDLKDKIKSKGGKKKLKIRLGVYFSIIVMAELFTILGASIAISYLFPLFDLSLPDWVFILFFSIIVGIACAVFVNTFVLSKISTLSRNMSRVANGEFNIELKTDSKIDEIQELYKSFNLMTKELSATEILQTDFVSNVSHEFKTPISAIDGYAMLLQDKSLTPEERDGYVEKILYNTSRLSSLVGNILLISKLDNQALGIRREKYRVDEQIRQSIVMLEQKWSEKKLSLDVDLENIEFFGNENLTFHIFNNIIDNAIKFNKVGGELKISLRSDDSFLIFSVADRGPGIDEESMRHIFDKFYQSDSSHKGEGNGLGLALVKRIVDILGGEIAAENRADGGCTFTVALPENSEE